MPTATESVTQLNSAPPAQISLSDEQTRVLESAMRGDNILITGSAGTGKSTLLQEMKKAMKWELPVTASTGISAVNVSGMTIHSWAGIGIGNDEPERIARRIIERQGEPFSRIRNYNRLAIDEISMISGRLFNLLDGVFQAVRKNGKPFGGMQLILFGDFLQLPPVIKTEEEAREGKFCFQSQSWQDAKIKVAMLTKVFRQLDASFSTALNEIRVGEPSEAARSLLNARYRVQDENSHIEPVIVHTHNVDVDATNAARLEKLQGKEEEFLAYDTGKPGPLATLQANCLAPEFLHLKIDAQVMLLKNLDPLSGLANGSIGRVVSFGKETKLPTILFANGLKIEISTAKFELRDGNTVLACRIQLPLRLAWAITVHKSQGMTLDKIQVHLEKVFEDGQAYVALSRARTAEGLFIQTGNKSNIRANPAAVEFYRSAQTI